MKKHWRNIFFLCGLAAVILMLFMFDSDWHLVRDVLQQAGIWFPVIVLLWGFIYLINACSFGLIIRDGKSPRVPFAKVFQLTVSGYALNYLTPLGLLGGEPYRVLELSGYVGNKKAVSSVLLYAMMHVCSHFCFWLSGIVLYVILHFTVGGKYAMGGWMSLMLGLLSVVFILVIWLFSLGYRRGFVVKVFGLLNRIPLVRRWSVGLESKNHDKLVEVDEQIGYLHAHRRAPFWWSLLLEYAARVVSCLEYWLLIGMLMPGFTFWDSILVMAFSSLFSNLIFFSPMQLGGYEGGMAMAAGGVQVPGAYGLYTAIVARVRQIVWSIIGVFLMKCGKDK